MSGFMHALRRDARDVLAWVGLSLIVAAVAVLDAPAQGLPRNGFDPVQIRKDMARVRSQLEAQRNRMTKRTGSQSRTTRSRPAAASSRTAEKASKPRADVSTRSSAGQELSYRLVPGMTFGYSIDIDIKRSYKSERFSGTPIFSVRSVDKDGDALVFAIGKLKCYSQLKGSEGDQERPNRTVWVGSVLEVSPSGRVSGKKDYKDTVLPVFLTTLIRLQNLFFPELPSSTAGEQSSEQSATLWLTMSGGSFVFNNSKQIEGREKRVLRATPVTGSMVDVRKERSFKGKDTPPTALWYRATSRIDSSRGLMVASSGSSETEEGPVTIKIRLLEGDELKRAVDQANADWADRPSELDTFELRRVRVALDSPRRLKAAEAKPGMVVAHFREGDHQWYLAQVLEVTDKSWKEVKIRYRGSDEVMEVAFGQLANLPAGKTP